MKWEYVGKMSFLDSLTLNWPFPVHIGILNSYFFIDQNIGLMDEYYNTPTNKLVQLLIQ